MAVADFYSGFHSSFADIHYFYGPETDNPPHHRFDKGSYVYLFENALEGRTRIEVANRPGTELQDAFDGCMYRLARSTTPLPLSLVLSPTDRVRPRPHGR